MISYEGIFFEKETSDTIHSLESKQLNNTNDIIHCTFKYHPTEDEIFDELVGKTFDIYLIAYANDGNNSLPEELIKYYINYDEENPSQLKIPHITASLALNTTASNTKKLDFKPLKNL